VRDGEDYIINGQKVWTSAAHVADWCWLAARTDPRVPKHKGISLFMVDMRSEGITVRPLVNLAGIHTFNEVFFDDVRVPGKNLVGEENRGWHYIVVALDFERAAPGVRSIARARRILDELVAYARTTRRGGQLLARESMVRHKLAEMAIECEVGRLIAYRVAWMQGKGLIPNYEASMSRMYSSELLQRVVNTAMQILGLWGQLEKNSPLAPLQGWIARCYLMSPSETIAAGTSEIQRNIIATRGLGLPRE
jgi:alkylation response protein AidB-like acyl-CoA dehydrogenase